VDHTGPDYVESAGLATGKHPGHHYGSQGRTDSAPLVAFVFSPLQALNLYEYCQRTQRRPEVVVVGSASTIEATTRTQIDSVLSLIKPKNVLHCEWSLWASRPKGARKALTSGAARLRDSLECAQSVDIVVGEYRSVYSWAVLRRIRELVNEIVVVDDGTAMLRIDRTHQRWLAKKQWRQLLKASIFLLLGIRGTMPPKKLTFFSAYSLDTRLGDGDVLVNNDYASLRHELRNLPVDEEHVYVIGTPHLEVGVVNEGDIDLALELGRFAAAKTGLRVRYMPHRRERAAKLGVISREFSVVSPNVPFELFPIAIGMRPKIIVGYYSSLFVTVHELLGDSVEIQAIEFPRARLNESWITFVNDVYDYYRNDMSSAIRVVEFPGSA
jgi:hypothetical protein